MANIGFSNTASTYKSYANGYKALIDTAFKQDKDYTGGIFYKDTTQNWDDRLVEFGGIDDFRRWDDGERASQSEMKEGYAKVFTQVPFGLEVPIGRLAKQFQPYNEDLTKRASKQLGVKAYLQMQKAPFSMFGYGFSTTNTYLGGIVGSTVSALTADGKNLFSGSHVCSPSNATTFSNVLTTSDPVSEAALESMLQNLYNQLDDKGQKKYYGRRGVIWMVPREAYAEALRIVGSDKRVGTADNDANLYKGSFQGSEIEVRLIPWLNDWSTTAHFLIAKEVVEEEMPIVMLTSTDFYSDDYTDVATDTVYVRGRMTYTVGALSGRGMVGSKGDLTTYSS